MNLRFIEAFVWVARLRSFKAAAEKLHTTQTAISARIATLENQFGVKLFERDKRTVVLTYSGEELLKYAEQLLGISARMMEAVADRSSYGGTVSIGAIETVVHTLVARAAAFVSTVVSQSKCRNPFLYNG